MTGAEYIVEFLRRRGIDKIFLITGGACTFIVDAIARNPLVQYYCFQHEQAAAMAADVFWRIERRVGATVVTSGPGATNIITGIACSYFDSIPTIHITGQVNQNEKLNYLGANVRQAGFQETKIVDMVKPITKYAAAVTTGEELKRELTKAFNIAITGRMGPVLIDVPMDIQKAEVGDNIEYELPNIANPSINEIKTMRETLHAFFQASERPLVLVGAGIGLAGVQDSVFQWLKNLNLPFVSSWNGMTFFDHDIPNYHGHIGVYGNRGANFLIQNCDRLLVLGSRLDNRQRSGDTNSFARSAKVLVFDVDEEELKKYKNNQDYLTCHLDLQFFEHIIEGVSIYAGSYEWRDYVSTMKSKYFGKARSTIADTYHMLSPYAAVQKINQLMRDDACVIADTGANLCWVFQVFHRKKHDLFTAGGNSPMGYSLPAAIGAALYQPERQVICFIGDGGMQMNIQELQTMHHYNLNIKLFVLNNFGYGIIKQFQDLYFEGRYEATGNGYSQPDFRKVTEAYCIPYMRIDKLEEIKADLFNYKGPVVIDLILHPSTWIEPKLEMGCSIEDQFPYLVDKDYYEGMKFSNIVRTGKKS
jgi:acetolactate synthase-1/2/3 large subunit